MRVTLGAMLLAAATSAASNDAASNEDVVNEAAVIDAVVNEATGGDATVNEATGSDAAANDAAAEEAAGDEATANEAPADAAVMSEDARVEEPAIPQEVDLFPSQPWASLVGGNTPQAPNGAAGSDTSQAAEPDALAPEQAKGEPELVRVPIHAVGEWIDDAHRIVVLESQGQTYLLCQRCSIADALRPGDTVAQQYQFKALEPSRAVLIDPQGREQHVDLAPLAQ
ncbi:hypothetical protein [Achromobacter kerstersii]|uniref:hypothetical protein n=1 Tax=Achromobacter kerstersii TaxID=1353890 RepID=UPI0012E30CCD|nr:hypothetical protein [Achromobacter kerstersii]